MRLEKIMPWIMNSILKNITCLSKLRFRNNPSIKEDDPKLRSDPSVMEDDPQRPNKLGSNPSIRESDPNEVRTWKWPFGTGKWSTQTR